MLTIVAWTIFLPAFFWNVLLFFIIFREYIERTIDWKNMRNYFDLIISLILLFVPGIYLFGWF